MPDKITKDLEECARICHAGQSQAINQTRMVYDLTLYIL